MAITTTIYGGFLEALCNGQLNLSSDTLKVALVSNSYTPADTDEYWSTPQAKEISGTGYTAGGQALTGVAVNYNTSTKTITLSANNPSWPNSTLTAYYAIIYDATPSTAATQPLIAYVNFGGAESDTSGTFEIQWSASGIVQISHI